MANEQEKATMNIQVLGRDANGYFYHTGEKSTRNVRMDRAGYDNILNAADKVNADYRQHSHASGLYLHFDNGFSYQPAQVAPGRTNEKRVVLVHHVDGYLETDAMWLARQEQLDYAATVDAASIYGQGA